MYRTPRTMTGLFAIGALGLSIGLAACQPAATPAPTDAMMHESATPDAMMETATPDAMMETSSPDAMMKETASPDAMMEATATPDAMTK